MSKALLPRLPMTKAVRALLASTTSKPVGKAAVPKIKGADGWKMVQPPYFICYPLWANTSGPPFAFPDADVEWIYQFSAYSKDGDQLEWMRDRILETFLDRDSSGAWVHDLEVPGMYVMDRAAKEDTGSLGGTDNASGIMSCDVRVGLAVTPI